MNKIKFGNMTLLKELIDNNPDDFRDGLKMDSSASIDVLLKFMEL